MSGPSLRDFNPESFTLEKYVEKLAQLDQRTGLGPLSKSYVKPFDAQILLESFEGSLKSLQELADKNKRRVDKLEHVCLKQEKEHAARIGDLESLYMDAFSEFQVLEDRINYVSTKVVHLGDQLETSNNRRTRAQEAQNLMHHLKEFEKPKLSLPIFTDPAHILEAADLIYKLQMLSSELPQGDREKNYKTLKKNIAEKYAEIESQLVDEFVKAQRSLDTKRMRQYAQALSPFNKGSQRAMDNYVHHNIPLQQFSSFDELLSHVEAKCKKAHDQIKEVFDNNPEVVMTKYIHTIIDKVLQNRIDSELRHLMNNPSHRERYLILLHTLYGKVMKLQERIAKFNKDIDGSFLAKLTRVNLFSKYLSTYAEIEVEHLSSRSENALSDFYDSVGISRRTSAGRLTISSNNEGETYVSQEVCTSILHEAKGAIKRAKALLTDKELSDVVKSVYFTVLEKLCQEHFHTALDIAQTVDAKTAPVGHFCNVVGNINTNLHLIEKLFREAIMPCIYYPPVATACVEKKRDIATKLEAKIETGIEKSLTYMVTHMKGLLSANQKKLDFRPETLVAEGTQACILSVAYIKSCCQSLLFSLDGKNLDVVLMELGMRFHRVIYEHIQQYIISEVGAMVIICDMNEYRNVMKGFKNPFIDELFEKLQTLCNIFIVKAENLSQVCSEEPYANFDRTVLSTMIQLRSDYKTAKLQRVNF